MVVGRSWCSWSRRRARILTSLPRSRSLSRSSASTCATQGPSNLNEKSFRKHLSTFTAVLSSSFAVVLVNFCHRAFEFWPVSHDLGASREAQRVPAPLNQKSIWPHQKWILSQPKVNFVSSRSRFWRIWHLQPKVHPEAFANFFRAFVAGSSAGAWDASSDLTESVAKVNSRTNSSTCSLSLY